MPQTRHYEMKDSGVEWIGKMPIGWKVIRNKALFEEVNERCGASPNLTLLSVSEYYGVAPRAEKIAEDEMLTRAESLEGYKICHKNDIVMNIMLAWKRSQGVSQYDGIVSPAYCVFRRKDDAPIDMRYIHYLIRTDRYADEYKCHSTGIIDSRLRLYPDKFLALESHVPPLSEQTAIAAYLDEKCATIDAIIAEAKASIEEYKSWKASVIFETVTKGLNPNAEMKDSGVEWIGRVSKGWKIVPAKFFMRVQAGYPFDSERFDNSQGIPLIRIRDITSGHTETFYNGDYPEEYVVHNNDLLVGMDGDFNVRWWQGGEAVLNQRCCRIFAQKGLILRYFYFLLPFYLKQVNELAYSTTVKHLANGDIGNADICLPPQNEQTAIVAYLDSKCAAIDGIILEKEELIRELENYKRSLIFEVVTGKRRVC